MREIKFRAWDKIKKKMYSSKEMGQDQLTLSPDDKGFINVHGTNTKLSEYYTHLLPLQYTGRKDSKGVEVYSGDIVHNEYGENYIIDSCVGGFECISIKDNGHWLFSVLNDNCKIIGNKFENPELLEVNK